MAALAEVFAERACRGPGGQVVDPLSVLPALFAILWRGRLAYLDNRVLDSGSTVWASRGGRADDPASGAASGRRHWGGDRGLRRRAVADRGLKLVTAAPW